MVPLEFNGGAASSSTEVVVFGVLALAIVVIGLLLFRSLKKVDVPYAADVDRRGFQDRAPAEQNGPSEQSGPTSGPDEPDHGAPEDHPQGS